MNETKLGDELLQLLISANENVLLVAPFMKAGAAARAFQHIGPQVSLQCYTRWRPEEVASGVSDLEVADLVAQRDLAELFLVADLHAKLFCSEAKCLVTSANLTATALGWRSPTNLEIGIMLPRSHRVIVSFEAALRQLATKATAEIRGIVRAASLDLPKGISRGTSPILTADSAQRATSISSWVPTCRVPSQLYALYRGWDVVLSHEATDDGFRDLEVLGVPLGLSSGKFTLTIRSLLLQHPRLSVVIGKARKERISGETAQQYFLDLIGPHHETADEAFQISAYWITHFFHDIIKLTIEEGREILSPTLGAEIS